MKWRQLLLMTMLVAVMASGSVRAQGPREGIVVRGSWVIEVRNRDGSLASRHAFENGLAGLPMLSRILARSATPGFWHIGLIAGTRNPFPASGMFQNEALITERDYGLTAPNFFKNLTLSDGVDGSFRLKGVATAVGGGSIASVATRNSICWSGTVASQDCQKTDILPDFFTSKALTTPIELVAEQSVHVTVTITFSSPAGS